MEYIGFQSSPLGTMENNGFPGISVFWVVGCRFLGIGFFDNKLWSNFLGTKSQWSVNPLPSYIPLGQGGSTDKNEKLKTMEPILDKLTEGKEEMIQWFEHLHRNPELSMKENNTAEYLAERVKDWGYEVETGIGTHGIVASLTVGNGTRAIGLRADFDALPIEEDNQLSYKSLVPGVSHLCGHDGHSTMLLAAGKYLAETKNFKGTVRLIFQPGEETMEGGPAMIKDGLFKRFPVDAVYGMHNMPGLELGSFYFADGDVMAAVDNWEIEITGKGGHGSMPELSNDPVVAASSLVMALQTIVSRNIAPAHSAVVTVGAF